MNYKCAPTAALAALAIVHAAAADTASFGSVRDNTLIEHTGGLLSNGAGAHFHVGRTEQPSLRRGLLAFDVAAIPPGSTVQSVTLTLFMSRTVVGPELISMHAALADWGEGTSDAPGNEGAGAGATPGDATWLHRYFDTDTWATAGGEFAASPGASLSVDGVGSYTFGSTPQLVADVQGWVDDPASANGWVFIGDEVSSPSTKRFDTKENPLPERHPLLTVEFMPPGGGTNLYFADGDGDDFGNPDIFIESLEPQPPAGFVTDNTDCDDTNPNVNPGADEVCENGIDDDCDGITDDCGADCNGNGVADFLDVLTGTSLDCNANGIPDTCDIAFGAAADANGNLIPDACEVSCCTAGDLRSLTLQYTSLTCAATTHSQDDGDVTCTDFGSLPDTVFILASDEEDPFDGGATVWFQGVVGPGAMFVVDAVNGGSIALDSRTNVHIFSQDGGTLLQSVEFRTNCSDPLAVGDQFGTSLVVDCLGVGGSPPCPADVNGDGEVDVEDLLAVILAWGATGPGPAADVTMDGMVGVDDLIAVVTLWGTCPL